MYRKTIQKEKKRPYAVPVLEVTDVGIESFLASSLNMRSTPQIADPEEGGVVDDDVIFGL
jgi:hypothetical protein